MLEEVMRHINNRFDRDSKGRAYGSKEGTFSIEGGTMEVDGLVDGQYFWVEGSVLNDGLHPYPATGMNDEVFDGKVVFLVVPESFAALADEIAAWCESNAEAIDSPYQSESFGGYSYTKAQGGSGGEGASLSAWQSHFGSRLNPYRKMSRDWV